MTAIRYTGRLDEFAVELHDDLLVIKSRDDVYQHRVGDPAKYQAPTAVIVDKQVFLEILMNVLVGKIACKIGVSDNLLALSFAPISVGDYRATILLDKKEPEGGNELLDRIMALEARLNALDPWTVVHETQYPRWSTLEDLRLLPAYNYISAAHIPHRFLSVIPDEVPGWSAGFYIFRFERNTTGMHYTYSTSNLAAQRILASDAYRGEQSEKQMALSHWIGNELKGISKLELGIPLRVEGFEYKYDDIVMYAPHPFLWSSLRGKEEIGCPKLVSVYGEQPRESTYIPRGDVSGEEVPRVYTPNVNEPHLQQLLVGAPLSRFLADYVFGWMLMNPDVHCGRAIRIEINIEDQLCYFKILVSKKKKFIIKLEAPRIVVSDVEWVVICDDLEL